MIAECYLASGQIADSRRVADALAKTNSNAQFAPLITNLLATLSALASDKEPPPSYYVGQCRRGWSGGCSLWTIIRAWQLRDASPDGGWVLAQLFGQYNRPSSGVDHKGYELALLAVARSPRVDPDRSAEALKMLADDAHDTGRKKQANDLWREIMDRYPDTHPWGAATYNVALTLRREGRCTDAIPVFEKLLGSKVNDLDPGSHIMETYRNYRPLAQWNIGLCKLSAGDYAGALTALRTLRAKYPFRSWCGNEQNEWDYRYDLYEGLTLEHLGRVPEAVVAYVHAAEHSSDGGPQADERLLALYAAAGQMADLRRMFASSPHKEGLPYRLRIMDLEEKKAWPELVTELRSVRRRNRGPVVTALGRHGDQTAPLLLAEVDKVDGKGRSNGATWRALGLAVTPRTVSAIVDRARRETTYDALAELVTGLHAAGPSGRTALTELEKDPTGRLRDVLTRQSHDDEEQAGKEDNEEDREHVVFPPLPQKIRLPTSIVKQP